MALEIRYYNANHNKDDIQFFTQFPCFWDTLYVIALFSCFNHLTLKKKHNLFFSMTNNYYYFFIFYYYNYYFYVLFRQIQKCLHPALNRIVSVKILSGTYLTHTIYITFNHSDCLLTFLSDTYLTFDF